MQNARPESAAVRERRVTIRITTDAMFAALFTVFAAYVSIRLGNIAQISLVSVPILLCAFLYGPGDAVIVATVGTFFEQLLTWGLAPDTFLWMAPTMIQAAFAGFCVWLCRYKPKKWQTLLIVIASEVLLTATNTGFIYIDNAMMGYPQSSLIAILPTRLTAAAIRMVITIPMMMLVVEPIRKLANRHGRVTPERERKTQEE